MNRGQYPDNSKFRCPGGTLGSAKPLAKDPNAMTQARRQVAALIWAGAAAPELRCANR